MTPHSLADRLREARVDAGLTQTELARRTGINVKTLSSWETGERTDSIRLVAFLKICYALELGALELIEICNEFRPLERRPFDPLARHTPDDYPVFQSSLGGSW